MRNLVFIGMVGSKMKLIAENTASILNRKFVDTDEVITRNIGMPLHDFYTLFPLDSISDITYRLSAQLSQGEDYVIAVGDSILRNSDAMAVLKKSAFIVYINQDLSDIIANCTETSHPLLARGLTRINELYNERETLFPMYADITVMCSETAAEEAIQAYNNYSAPASEVDPALHAFFRYYIESKYPNMNSSPFADECSKAVNDILSKYISEEQ